MLSTGEEFEKLSEIKEKKIADAEIEINGERLSDEHIERCNGCSLCEK